MADTQRTIAALQALLADNVTGDISAADVRDMLVSLAVDHGEIYVSSSAATTIGTVNVWYQVGGTWSLSDDSRNFSMDTNGRIQFDGDDERHVRVSACASLMTAANNKTFELAVAKNGTPIAPSIMRRKVNSTTDVGVAAVQGKAHMTSGDYLSLMIRGISDTTAPTIVLANLTASGSAD